MFGSVTDITTLSTSKKLKTFTNFGVQHNLKCNIRCACCYDLDQPTIKVLNDKLLEPWIKECAELDIPAFLCAGEPFLYWDWIKDIFLPMCNQYETKYLISTNGYWGKNTNLCKEVADRVKNLTISVDWWHQQFIPKETVISLLEQLQFTPTKVFISTIVNTEHPAEEVNLPFDSSLMYLYFRYLNNREENFRDAFTHDFEGNILFQNKAWGKSLNDLPFDKMKEAFPVHQNFFKEYQKEFNKRKNVVR
jgi:hypothetical protein